MDLSKTFDSVLYDLLIAKLHAGVPSFDTVTFPGTYQQNRKQNVKINKTCSMFENLLSCGPQ